VIGRSALSRTVRRTTECIGGQLYAARVEARRCAASFYAPLTLPLSRPHRDHTVAAFRGSTTQGFKGGADGLGGGRGRGTRGATSPRVVLREPQP
jgi:hypothetical protein